MRVSGLQGVAPSKLVRQVYRQIREDDVLTYAAALVAFTVYALGFTASFWLPEPKQAELPE